MLTFDVEKHGRLLTAEEASRRLRERFGVSRTPGTLGIQRVRGGGPEFVKIGRQVRYPERLLDEYATRLAAVEIVGHTPTRIGEQSGGSARVKFSTTR